MSQEHRERMVRDQLVSRGIRDPRVLDAMRRVDRERFAPVDQKERAYGDHPVAIGYEQTLSQPYIVARMTEVLELSGDERVLDIGTGSGYQTAVLAELAAEVFTIERVSVLAEEAEARLRSLGYRNIHYRVGDGRLGWPEHAPYRGIVVAAATPEVPKALRYQLEDGGRLVIPVGPPEEQSLELHRRIGDTYQVEDLGPVRFVPLV